MFLDLEKKCQPCGSSQSFFSLNSLGSCVERCGTGVNFGQLECDDGNLKDGDGCSSRCLIESGWTCSGSLGGPSSCSYIKTVLSQVVLLSSDILLLEFSRPIKASSSFSDTPGFTI